MWDEKKGDYFSLRVPIMRTISVSRNRGVPVREAPLNVLVVTANPSDYEELAVVQEKERLERSLAPLVERGLLTLAWLPGGTWKDLRAALLDDKRWHVLHFIGHGGFDDEKDEGYIALVRPESTESELVTATDLARLLESQTRLRLVVLNACNTGQAGVDEAYAGTAATLVRNNVDSVVAMQYPVSDIAAAKFTEALYTEILRSPVDLAVTRARVELAQLTKDRKTLEWATPVLYMRTPDSLLFDLPDVVVPSPVREPAPVLQVDEDRQPETDPSEFLAEATDALTEGDHDDAFDILRRHQDEWPDNREVVLDLLEALAAAYQTQGKLSRAKSVLELAVRTDPQNLMRRVNLSAVTKQYERDLWQAGELRGAADRSMTSGQWEFARTLLEHARSLEPDSAEIRSDLVRAEHELDKSWLLDEIKAARLQHKWRRVFDLLEQEPAARGISEEELAAILEKLGTSVDRLTAQARVGLLRQSDLPAEEKLVLAHRKPVWGLVFSPTGTKIATCDIAGVARTWWTSDGSLIRRHPSRRFAYGIRQAALDLGAPWLTMATGHSELVTWNVLTGERMLHVAELDATPAGISAGPSGLVAAAVGQHVEIWDVEAGLCRYRGYRHTGPLTGLCFAGPDRELLVTTTQSHLRVWSVPDDELLVERTLPEVTITLATDRDGRCVVVLTSDGRIFYWPVVEMMDERPLTRDARAVAVDVSQDGELLIAAFADRTVSIVDVQDGMVLKTLTAVADVHDVEFAPDGWSFAIACADGLVRVYRLRR
jgi:WD40 repeat protein